MTEVLLAGNTIARVIKNLQQGPTMNKNNPYLYYLLGNSYCMQSDYEVAF